MENHLSNLRKGHVPAPRAELRKSLAALSLASIAISAILGLMGCGSTQALPGERAKNEAEHLQSFCQRTSVTDTDAKKADSLLASSAKYLKDGDKEPALSDAQLANSYYRLALAHHDLNQVQGQVEGLKTALAKDKDKLQTYQQILEEMKTVRKP